MRRTKIVMVAMVVVASMFELSSSAAVATNGLPVLLRGARASGLSTTPTKHGIVVPVQSTGADLCYVELAVANDNAFRVSISYSGSPPVVTDSPMVAPQESYADFTKFTSGSFVGIKTSFGSLKINPNSGEFAMADSNGNNITSTPRLSSFSPPGKKTQQSVSCTQAPRAGTDITDGTRVASAPDGLNVSDQGSCCDACQKDSQCTTWVYATANPYGGKNCWLMYDVHTTSSAQDRVVGGKVDPPPPSSTCEHVQVGADVTGGARVPDHPDGILVSKQDDCCSACDEDSDCTVWVFASDGSTPQGKNCWLLSSADSTQPSSNRNVGGAVAPTPPPPGSLRVSLGQSGGALYYGAGTGGDDSHTLTRTSSFPKVANTAFYTPHYYSTDGYAALGVSSLQYDPATIYAYPVSWDAHQAGTVQWLISGDQADLYLMPSSSLYAGLDKYWDLTGRPAVVPKYAFGFLASRWGWENESYIESTLHKFRDGKYPIDAFISDFGWYTPTNDYNLPDTGDPNFHDFSYNPATFPDPTSQLKKYHEELHFRFGGIRKPRLGNSELLAMAHKNGWTVNAPHAAGAPGGTRNLNYSMEVVRDWYQKQQAHYLKDGVDFWWNDEAETFYFAFHWWNVAQSTGLSLYDKLKRFFTINRSFTPGMQRLGAITWTGDIPVSWESLTNQPGYFLNWALAGTAYVTCDTGGFVGGDTEPLLLVRWYQMAQYMPIMRVHSTKANVPHFPFLYGSDADDAMKHSLEMRYRLLPYHYSLGHAAFRRGGKPLMRPLVMEFPNEASVALLTSQWLDGDHLLIAPVLSEHNSTTVTFPASTLWYELNSTKTHTGPQDLQLHNVPLDSVPVYARAGAVIPFGPVVQYSDQIGTSGYDLLDLHIYAGANGKFIMVEDDGETYAYAQGSDAAVKETMFNWNEAKRTLTWSVSGNYSGENVFKTMNIIVFFESSGTPVHSGPITLGKSGSHTFNNELLR